MPDRIITYHVSPYHANRGTLPAFPADLRLTVVHAVEAVAQVLEAKHG
jgi:hypothetical protein